MENIQMSNRQIAKTALGENIAGLNLMALEQRASSLLALLVIYAKMGLILQSLES